MINNSIENIPTKMPKKKLIIILSSLVFILFIILGFVLQNQFKVFSNIFNKQPEVNSLDSDPTMYKDIEDDPIEKEISSETDSEKPVEETPVTKTPTTTTTPETQNPPPTTVPTTPTSTPYSFVLKETSYNESIKVEFSVPSVFTNVIVTQDTPSNALGFNLKYVDTNMHFSWFGGVQPILPFPAYHYTSVTLIQEETLMNTGLDHPVTFSNFGDLYRVKSSQEQTWEYTTEIETQKDCYNTFNQENPVMTPPCGYSQLHIPTISNYFVLSCSGSEIGFCDEMAKRFWISKIQ